MKFFISSVLLTMIATTAAEPDVSSLAGPLINLGAVGVCLVALALWHIKKDSRYEAIRDAEINREREIRKEVSELHAQFRKEAMEMAEKYRLAMEKFNQTLDSVIRMMASKRGKGGDS